MVHVITYNHKESLGELTYCWLFNHIEGVRKKLLQLTRRYNLRYQNTIITPGLTWMFWEEMGRNICVWLDKEPEDTITGSILELEESMYGKFNIPGRYKTTYLQDLQMLAIPVPTKFDDFVVFPSVTFEAEDIMDAKKKVTRWNQEIKRDPQAFLSQMRYTTKVIRTKVIRLPYSKIEQSLEEPT